MSLFGRRRSSPAPGVPDHVVPGLAEVAQSLGFVAISGRVFDGHFEDVVARSTPPMYGVGSDAFSRKVVRIGATEFSDAFRGTVNGRTVTVANGWTNIGPELRFAPGDLRGVAVCTVELPSILLISSVQPRQFPAVADFPALPTGDAMFDRRFLVGGMPGADPSTLTPEVRGLIGAHDDWLFRAERYLFGCIGQGAFASGDEVRRRIDEVMAIVAALPVSVMPDHVDHTEDDLVARVSRLTSLDEAIAFLQHLDPGERERLARSDTPLAAFADVHTPEDARARFMGLDESQRLQVLAMFLRVKDERSDL